MTNILKPASQATQAETQVFNILNIGKRGVGKTVFIAGAYIELCSKNQIANPQKLWLEVPESENIKIITDYIDKTGKYPPPTLKISRSSFNLKQETWLGTKTLCNFIWSDVPGEICDIDNADFRKMAFNSHGCSVFIDATTLMYRSNDQQALQEIIEIIAPLRNLSYLNKLNFTFAVILTKCDLLEDEPLARQRLNEKLQPLITYLSVPHIKYQIFYSSVPLVIEKGVPTLKPKGTEEPLVWLVRQIGKSKKANNLIKVFDDLRPKQSQLQDDTRANFRNIFLLRLLSNRQPIIIFVTITLALGVIMIGLIRKDMMNDQQDIKIEKTQ